MSIMGYLGHHAVWAIRRDLVLESWRHIDGLRRVASLSGD